MTQWAATQMPAWRREQARYYLDSAAVADAEPAMAEQLAVGFRSQGRVGTVGQELFDSAARWRGAELFWVTADMARVALDASADMPEFTPAAICPAPAGLLAWAAPYPPVPWEGGRMVPVDAVHWATFGGHVHIEVLTRTDRIAVHLGPRAAAVALHSVCELRLPAAEVIDLAEHGAKEFAGLWAALAATWVLMELPTVAQARTVTGAGTSAREDRRVPRGVRIVDLRAIEHRPTDDPDGAEHPGRVYAHRWVVRGHWRQQPVGPNRSERRPTWIPSHTKGPEGAPLLVQDVVNVWRR